MPVEVIDLLSSPEWPKLKAKPLLPKATLSAADGTREASVSKALTYESKSKKSAHDDWFILSSDGVGMDDAPILPAPKISNTNAGMDMKANWDFSALEKTTDENSNTVATKSNISAPSKPLSTINGNSNHNFFFMSDDFDTMVNKSDDPFADELPPVKRRRLSRSPGVTRSKAREGYKEAFSIVDSSPRAILPKASGYKRSLSNIESSSNPNGTNTSFASGLKRSKTMNTVLESDPIVFTSSPDPFAEVAKRREKRKSNRDEDEDDILDRGKGNVVAPNERRTDVNKRTKMEIFELSGSSESDLPNIGDLKAAPRNAQSSMQSALAKYKVEKAADKKAKDKTQKAQEKTASKEAEKEKKRLAKEEKIREKERAADIAKANTLRTDKKVSTPEMIIDLPASLGERLLEQIKRFLVPVEVEHSDWESPLPVVKWRRKVTATYNDDLGYWEPTAPYVKKEKHIMCILTAQEFVDLAMAEEGKDMDAHILSLKAKFDTCEVIYLLEGVTNWMKKNRTVKNRQFTEAVRNQMPQTQVEASGSQRPSKRKKQPEYVDEDVIEDALLKLQVTHGALIHHTASLVETAQWVVTFTQHISTIPYRTQKASLNTAFCMESGQVKTGDDPSDIYTKMLQEIIRVTAPIAYGIAAEYPTLQLLAQGLRDNGPLALEDCMKCANRDGAFTDRRIGPAISKRVYTVFMGRDEGCLDV